MVIYFNKQVAILQLQLHCKKWFCKWN